MLGLGKQELLAVARPTRVLHVRDRNRDGFRIAPRLSRALVDADSPQIHRPAAIADKVQLASPWRHDWIPTRWNRSRARLYSSGGITLKARSPAYFAISSRACTDPPWITRKRSRPHTPAHYQSPLPQPHRSNNACPAESAR